MLGLLCVIYSQASCFLVEFSVCGITLPLVLLECHNDSHIYECELHSLWVIH
jgi:hypothetical protein